MPSFFLFLFFSLAVAQEETLGVPSLIPPVKVGEVADGLNVLLTKDSRSASFDFLKDHPDAQSVAFHFKEVELPSGWLIRTCGGGDDACQHIRNGRKRFSRPMKLSGEFNATVELVATGSGEGEPSVTIPKARLFLPKKKVAVGHYWVSVVFAFFFFLCRQCGTMGWTWTVVLVSTITFLPNVLTLENAILIRLSTKWAKEWRRFSTRLEEDIMFVLLG